MKSKVKRFVLWIIPAVLLYLLCLYGWIPTITEYISTDISAASKTFIFVASTAGAVAFAFSVYSIMTVFAEHKKEKKRVFLAGVLMVIYVVAIVLLKLLYEGGL